MEVRENLDQAGARGPLQAKGFQGIKVVPTASTLSSPRHGAETLSARGMIPAILEFPLPPEHFQEAACSRGQVWAWDK